MSYGQNAPFGLKPVQLLGGEPWNGSGNQVFYVASPVVIAQAGVTGFYFNDPVILKADGGLDGVANAADAQAIVGSFQGCSYVGPDGVPVWSQYLLEGQTTLNNSPIEVYVASDPDILFEVQVAVSAAGPSAAPYLTAANVNENGLLSQLTGTYNVLTASAQVPYNLVGTTPAANPTASPGRSFGLSAFYLAFGSLAAANATYNVKVVQLTDNLQNNIYSNTQGNIIFNTALVLINNHPYKGGTGTAGV